ncbi:MAG: crotonase/enoyl-CoA hydratase family protein [Minwuia sp.]|nr:crotonase/enoyl-CoA hydratase family protein [Minwuia sp.]
MTDPVTFETRDGVSRIAMDDGKVNLMTLAMLQALHDAFDRAAEHELPVLLQGREGVFSAGFDLKVFASGDMAASHAMVRAGAELALKVLAFPRPVVSVCTGHAFPMGAFLLLASDVRIGVEGPHRIGLNEVAIGIPVPSFGIELARQRLTPAWLSRTVTTGEMFSPNDAATAGFLDRVVPQPDLERSTAKVLEAVRQIHLPSHATVKPRLRGSATAAVRAAIDAEITLEAYQANQGRRDAVRLPGNS